MMSSSVGRVATIARNYKTSYGAEDADKTRPVTATEADRLCRAANVDNAGRNHPTSASCDGFHSAQCPAILTAPRLGRAASSRAR